MKVSEIPEEQAVGFAVTNPEKAVEIAKRFPGVIMVILKNLPNLAVEIATAVPNYAATIAQEYETARAEIVANVPAATLAVVTDLVWAGKLDKAKKILQHDQEMIPEVAKRIIDSFTFKPPQDKSPGTYWQRHFGKTILKMVKMFPDSGLAIAELMPERKGEWDGTSRDYYDYMEVDGINYFYPRGEVIALTLRLLPESAKFFVKSFPHLLKEIIKAYPEQTMAICKLMPEIVNDVVKINPEFAVEIAKMYPKQKSELAKIVSQNPTQLAAFAKAFPELFKLE